MTASDELGWIVVLIAGYWFGKGLALSDNAAAQTTGTER